MTLILSGTDGLSDVDGSAATPAIRGTDANTGIFFPAADTIAFSEGGVESMRIDSSGNVGIGVASPLQRFNAVNTSITGGAPASSGSSADPNAVARFQAGSVVMDFGVLSAGQMWIQNRASSNYATNYDLVLNPNGGNVGIGTASPSAVLHLNRAGSTDVYTYYQNGNGGVFLVGTNGSTGEAFLYNGANKATVFHTNAIERMRIDSSGNLLVGTTSVLGNERLNVTKDAANQEVARFYNANNSTPWGILVNYSAAAPNGTSNNFIGCYDTAGTRATIRSNGGLANYSANNVNLSDRREKTNFAPAGDYLSKICAIPVQTFNYIDQNIKEDAGLTLGVVAQDVQAVAPELVSESNWGTEENPKMRLSIYQTDLQYALMKCIQEQQAIITQLQADVAALKGTA